MASKPSGTLIIGGAEDRTKEKGILGEVARRVGRHRLVVTSTRWEELRKGPKKPAPDGGAEV